MTDWSQESLNSEQLAAIEYPGSVVLVACPGSGKTRTLTYKVAEELANLQSERQFVVAITYTHRAAEEIEERIAQLGVDTQQLWIGTIHAFCLEWIIRPYGIYHPKLRDGYQVINSHETEQIITRLCTRSAVKVTHFDCGYHFTTSGRVLQEPKAWKHAAIDAVLDSYVIELENSRLIDFEHILLYAYELIQSQPEISTLLSQIFTFVAVDEYQDTREIQYEIVASILRAGAGAVRTLIVGDPNQAIFGSLGGYAVDPVEYSKQTGLALKTMELSRNYRSSARIIDYFGHFKVAGSAITAASAAAGYPSEITFDDSLQRSNLENEIARLILHSINDLGIPPHEICVVAPWWAHLAALTRSLVALLPEYDFDGPGLTPFARDHDNFWYKLARIGLTQASPRMFISRLRWARELLNDLDAAMLTTGSLDARSLLRISNGIHLDETGGVDYLRAYFDRMFEALQLDFSLIPTLAGQHTAFFLESQTRIDRLEKEGAPFVTDVEFFRKAFHPRSGITVSTIHGVKGAEFDTVIAFALMDGMVPHFNDIDQLDGAKRLLYVVGSRARKNLHLIAERGRRRGVNRGDYTPSIPLNNLAFEYDNQ